MEMRARWGREEGRGFQLEAKEQKKGKEKKECTRFATHHSVIPRLTKRPNASEFPFRVDASLTKLLEDLGRAGFGNGVGHSTQGARGASDGDGSFA